MAARMGAGATQGGCGVGKDCKTSGSGVSPPGPYYVNCVPHRGMRTCYSPLFPNSLLSMSAMGPDLGSSVCDFAGRAWRM